jgi:uncharacterized repeat protein (TIGR01451 family)
MKISHKVSVVVLASFLTLGFAGPTIAFAATTPSLGDAATYGILSTTFTRNIGLTAITGDVGYTTLSGGGTDSVSGITSTPATPQSGQDQNAALANLNGQACDFTFNSPTDLSLLPQPLAPGVYCITAAASIGTGGIILSGAGTHIFRIAGALTSAANSIVSVTGGASACDVFWTPGAAATLGANTTFIGTLIDDHGITIGNTTAWAGRALAFGLTVTADTDTIAVPDCTAPVPATLHVFTQVTNTGGGVAIPSTFNLHVTFSGGGDVATSPQTGNASGTSYSLVAGNYAVSEDTNSSYTQSFSGDCGAGGAITLSAGQDKTCTITNTYIIPPPTAPTCTLTANPTAITTGDSSTLSWTTANATSFAIDNSVGSVTPVASGSSSVSPITTTMYTGTAIGTGGSVQCAATVTPTPPPAVSFGGGAGGGGSVFPPPLINVTKIPNPLALPSGPGSVTYTYAVKNVGISPMTGVTVTDNKCSPTTFVSGDTNNNSQLDVNETWLYHCTTTLSQTTTNTVTATGHANGFTAIDTADATVVVGVGTSTVSPLIPLTTTPSAVILPVSVVAPRNVVIPKLPNTGFPPYGASTDSDAAIVASILMILLISFAVGQRKHKV